MPTLEEKYEKLIQKIKHMAVLRKLKKLDILQKPAQANEKQRLETLWINCVTLNLRCKGIV